MKKNKITVWAVLCMALAFTACTQDDAALPADTDNALAALPDNTPVQIITMLDGKETESRAATETFAENEIHEAGKMVAHLYIVDDNGTSWGNDGKQMEIDFAAGDHNNDGNNYVSFDGIKGNTELSLGMFQNEIKWTILWGENHKSVFSLADSICGWSQLALHATTGKPVLVYNMHRTRAKVTLKLKDAETGNDMCLYKGVFASVFTEQTLSSVIKENNDFALAIYNNPLKSKNNDGDAEYFHESNLHLPYNVDGVQQSVSTDHAEGSGLYELTGLVYASATHKYELTDNSTMTQGGTFTRLENLTQETVNYDWAGQGKGKAYLWVEIDHGHDNQTTYPDYPHLGDNGGGTYRVNLEDIEMGNGKQLTRLDAGKHYIITLELNHNKLVKSTATIGNWDEYVGSESLGDESKEETVTSGSNPNNGTSNS